MVSRLPLRLRVAIAFALTTAVALVGLGAFVYYRVSTTLVSQVENSLATQLDALARVPVEDQAAAVEELTGESFAQILDGEGDIVATSPQVSGPLVAGHRLPSTGEDVLLDVRVRLAGEDEAEAATVLVRHTGDRALVVGLSREDVDDALDELLAQLLIGGPTALLLASGLGYVVAGAALRPMDRWRRRAASISARSSDERLPLSAADDEVRRLGSTLNAMLDRLDAGIRRERRFVSEASHELRTPLALLRMELDLALARPRSSEELLAALRSANEEVDRLSRLSEDLLLLAASDEERLQLDPTEFEVRALLREVAHRFTPRADESGRVVSVDDGPAVRLHADRARLDQAVTNLVDNALRHGQGAITLAVTLLPDGVAISVRDEGPGMSDEVRTAALDRFRQGSGRRSGGRGLGLAIVDAIVREHGGTVTLERAPEGDGTVVTVGLPRS